MNNLKVCASALIMMAAASLQCFAQTTSIDKNGSLRTIKFQYSMFRIVIILAVLFTQTLSNHAQDFTSNLHAYTQRYFIAYCLMANRKLAQYSTT